MDKKKCSNAKICERCGHIAVCGENYCMFCGVKLKNKLVFLVQRQGIERNSFEKVKRENANYRRRSGIW